MNREEFKTAIAAAASNLDLKTENGRSAFAQIIVESIEPNHLTLDVVSAFLPTRQLQPGDLLLKRVRKGFPVRTFVPGTTHLADQIAVRDVYTHMLDQLVVKTRWNSMELRRGEIGTIEQFRADMEAALIDAIVSKVFSLLATVWDGTTTGTNYLDATSTGLTETNLTNMMETVLYRAGDIRAIVGSRAALLPVYKFAGMTEFVPTSPNSNGIVAIPSVLDEWRRTGRIRTFNGAPLVELPQVFKRTFDGYDDKLIPDDKVLVIGDAAGEAVLFGGTESQESYDYDIEPADYVLAIWRQYGMIIDNPRNIGVIKVAEPTLNYVVS